MDYNINEIKNYMDWFPYTEDDDFSENEIYNFIENLDMETFELSNYDTGATKLVIIPVKTNYVIKIPFNYIERNSRRSSTDNDSFYDDYTSKVRFSFATLEKEAKWNYCELEEEIYKQAKIEGWADFFAEIKRVKEIEIFPTYVQQKVEYYKKSERDKELENVISELCYSKRVRQAALTWYVDLFRYFDRDKSKFTDFISFLKESNIDEDLHMNNVGYDLKTGQPLIVDYGGFREYD